MKHCPACKETYTDKTLKFCRKEAVPIDPEINLRWTNDGRYIVFAQTIKGVSNLWAQPVAGGPPKQITDFTSERMIWFDLSQDGKQLAISRGTQIGDVVLINLSRN